LYWLCSAECVPFSFAVLHLKNCWFLNVLTSIYIHTYIYIYVYIYILGVQCWMCALCRGRLLCCSLEWASFIWLPSGFLASAVSLFIYAYIYICIYIYIHVYRYKYWLPSGFLASAVSKFIYAYTYVYIYIYMYIDINMYM